MFLFPKVSLVLRIKIMQKMSKGDKTKEASMWESWFGVKDSQIQA